ncbi:hypothetical protein A2U01_0078194, partial [Trifolium medium]|nr:hypothetical protein [Trifolium medium]
MREPPPRYVKREGSPRAKETVNDVLKKEKESYNSEEKNDKGK